MDPGDLVTLFIFAAAIIGGIAKWLNEKKEEEAQRTGGRPNRSEGKGTLQDIRKFFSEMADGDSDLMVAPAPKRRRPKPDLPKVPKPHAEESHSQLVDLDSSGSDLSDAHALASEHGMKELPTAGSLSTKSTAFTPQEMKTVRKKKVKAPIGVAALLSTRSGLRDAIVAMEILGPAVSRRPRRRLI